MRRTLARSILRLSRLPSLPPVAVSPNAAADLDRAADRLLGGDARALEDAPLPRLDFLRWLGERRDVLFHGSGRDDLDVLEPIRLTTDTTEFGNRQAVYATDDPVWAIYFAILQRHGSFGTRNGSIGVAGAGLYPRWYFFSLTRPLDRATRFGDGFLYVLPRRTFESQPPGLGVVNTAQWVSEQAVRPLVRLDVTPADFPFLDAVAAHRGREPMLVTLARVAARRQRSARR